ncbi:MAG: FAD-linked oxidase C-terminal domain-containing protein, partial [Ferruginibacter sp.]
WTGANVLKNSTGYNLTQLMVGSEGTLGLITKIVLKLIPYPKYDLLMLVPFSDVEMAGAAVSAIFRAGFTPSALELVEINALRIVSKFLDNTVIPISDDTQAHLIIETDGNDLETLTRDMEAIAQTLEEFNCGEIFFADNSQQKDELWKLRRRVAEAVKIDGYTIEEDTVVPRANLPALINGVKLLGEQHNFKVVCYGHAGDGNLHVRIKMDKSQNSLNNPEVIPILKKLFELVFSLGGTISGEHGIGLIQKPFMDIVFKPAAIDIMKGIKFVFDPKNILNPGKIFN